MYGIWWFRVYGPKMMVFEFYGLRQIFTKFWNYLLGFTAKNNPKFSSLGFTVQISLILCKCAFGTIFGTFTCTMHLPKLPFRKIKWSPSTHIGESATHRFAPPTKRPNFIDFGQMCTCTDFWSIYSPNHTANRTSEKCHFANLNRYHRLTTQK